MKKTLILVSCATMLFACGNNTHNANGSHTANHAAHSQPADTNASKQEHVMQDAMNKMMHDMHAAKPTGNNDLDFAAMMLEHHKGAVDMSRIEIDKGSDTALKAFAQKVIDDQEKEIALMQEFISKASKTFSANAAAFQKAMSNSMMAMMSDSTITYNNIDRDFAAQMIPHHQSAVDMAKAYLQYGHHKSLKTLCENIITSQTKEIGWLKDWLGKHIK